MATTTADFAGEPVKKKSGKTDEDVLETSADGQRAFNDPTTDPYHTRGMDPRTAEAGFRAAGFTGPGPLADRKPHDNLPVGDMSPHGDTDVVYPGDPNPTADANPAPGGVIRAEALVDPGSRIGVAQNTKPGSKPVADSATKQAEAEAKDTAAGKK